MGVADVVDMISGVRERCLSIIHTVDVTARRRNFTPTRTISLTFRPTPSQFTPIHIPLENPPSDQVFLTSRFACGSSHARLGVTLVQNLLGKHRRPLASCLHFGWGKQIKQTRVRCRCSIFNPHHQGKRHEIPFQDPPPPAWTHGTLGTQ